MINIDMDFLLKHAVRPTEEFVFQKMEFDTHFTKERAVLTQTENYIHELDREYSKYTDKLPASEKIALSTNRPVTHINKILDRIEDKLYYKYLSY